jgi:multidrug efflux pump subunit AcrB
MTSLAIVAGSIPSALSLGPGAELRSPMGTAVIGGTIVSTLLTLFVVPCAYGLMARLESKRKEARMREVMETMGEKPE